MWVRRNGRTEEQQVPADNGQHAGQLDHFAECIANGTDPLVPGEEGLADMRVIEAIYRSAREGGGSPWPDVPFYVVEALRISGISGARHLGPCAALICSPLKLAWGWWHGEGAGAGRIAIAMLLAGAAASPAMAEGCKVGLIAAIPVTMQGLRPVVETQINGRPAPFVLDSGAFTARSRPRGRGSSPCRKRRCRSASTSTASAAVRTRARRRFGISPWRASTSPRPVHRQRQRGGADRLARPECAGTGRCRI